jgi:hypothetical protein
MARSGRRSCDGESGGETQQPLAVHEGQILAAFRAAGVRTAPEPDQIAASQERLDLVLSVTRGEQLGGSDNTGNAACFGQR